MFVSICPIRDYYDMKHPLTIGQFERRILPYIRKPYPTGVGIVGPNVPGVALAVVVTTTKVIRESVVCARSNFRYISRSY